MDINKKKNIFRVMSNADYQIEEKKRLEKIAAKAAAKAARPLKRAQKAAEKEARAMIRAARVPKKIYKHSYNHTREAKLADEYEFPEGRVKSEVKGVLEKMAGNIDLS